MTGAIRHARQAWPVAHVDELPIGGRKLVEVDGKSVGLFNVKGRLVAVLNVCPHELAPSAGVASVAPRSPPRPASTSGGVRARF